MRARNRATALAVAIGTAVLTVGSLAPAWNKAGGTGWVVFQTWTKVQVQEPTPLWGAIHDLIENGNWSGWSPGGNNFQPTAVLLFVASASGGVVYWLCVRRVPTEGAEDYGDGLRGRHPVR